MLGFDACDDVLDCPENASHGLSTACLSTYQPRECGLASYCEDLLTATLAVPTVGGPQWRGMYRFLDDLTKPVVTTLHTVFPSPSPPQHATHGRSRSRTSTAYAYDEGDCQCHYQRRSPRTTTSSCDGLRTEAAVRPL
jgi:hypothetical protein